MEGAWEGVYSAAEGGGKKKYFINTIVVAFTWHCGIVSSMLNIVRTQLTLIVCSMQLPTSVSPNDRGGDEDEPPVDSFLAGGRGGGCLCVCERDEG